MYSRIFNIIAVSRRSYSILLDFFWNEFYKLHKLSSVTLIVIRLERIKMEEKKIKSVLDWLTLKEVKDVQKFLGLANYYQQFIQDFTVIVRPLHNLVKKD